MSFDSILYLNKCCFIIIPAMLINTLADYCIQIFQLQYIVFLTFFNNSLQKSLNENISVYICEINSEMRYSILKVLGTVVIQDSEKSDQAI